MLDRDAAATGAGVVSEDLDSLDGRVGATEDLDAATVHPDGDDFEFYYDDGGPVYIALVGVDYEESTRTITFDYGSNGGVELPLNKYVYIDYIGGFSGPDPDGIGPATGELFDSSNWFSGGTYSFKVKFSSVYHHLSE